MALVGLLKLEPLRYVFILNQIPIIIRVLNHFSIIICYQETGAICGLVMPV